MSSGSVISFVNQNSFQITTRFPWVSTSKKIAVETNAPWNPYDKCFLEVIPRVINRWGNAAVLQRSLLVNSICISTINDCYLRSSTDQRQLSRNYFSELPQGLSSLTNSWKLQGKTSFNRQQLSLNQLLDRFLTNSSMRFALRRRWFQIANEFSFLIVIQWFLLPTAIFLISSRAVVSLLMKSLLTIIHH